MVLRLRLSVVYDMTQFGQYRYDILTLLRDTHDRLNGKPRRRLWQD